MNAFIDRLDMNAPGVWLPLTFGTVVLFFVVFMPKRQINWRGIYLTFGLVGYVGVMLDINILGEYFDLFDLGNKDKEGIGDLMSYAVIPSCLAVIFLNYFNKEHKWLHVALFTSISYVYEWWLTRTGYMKLIEWQSWYSLPVFIVVYGVWLPWHLEIIKAVATGNVKRKYPACIGAEPEPACKPLEQDGNDDDHGKRITID